MAAPARRIAGARAYAAGTGFESFFQRACIRVNIKATRIPDGCKVIGRGRLIRVRSPFDWVISHQTHSALIDTKTLNKASFPRSSIDEDQARELYGHTQQDVRAGYVVYLRKVDQIIWIYAGSLIDSIHNGKSPAFYPLGTLADFDPRRIFLLITAHT